MAVGVLKAGDAVAAERGSGGDACATVLTWACHAAVNVRLASGPEEAGGAGARKAAQKICAGAAVVARLGRAVVGVCLAVFARKPSQTCASIVVDDVGDALGTVFAG